MCACEVHRSLWMALSRCAPHSFSFCLSFAQLSLFFNWCPKCAVLSQFATPLRTSLAFDFVASRCGQHVPSLVDPSQKRFHSRSRNVDPCPCVGPAGTKNTSWNRYVDKEAGEHSAARIVGVRCLHALMVAKSMTAFDRPRRNAASTTPNPIPAILG